MTPKVKRLFIVVIALQVVFLLGIVGYRESILILGRTAVLETVPVDPRDLFRGEFVVLRYEISTIGNNISAARGIGEIRVPDAGEIVQPVRREPSTPSKSYLLLGEISEGDTVYVGLPGDNDDRFKVLHVQTGGPSPETDLFIKGRVTHSKDGTIMVEYGIEQYFVPEGRGLEIENADDVKVRVSINRSGTAAIKELIVDGEVWQP
ncbi:MAG: GDYXXLXY domain-containing protein [Chloroflexi bacterium]|nr:GDYXXLXY domain-containing protein [Chloroflexota bacterium]